MTLNPAQLRPTVHTPPWNRDPSGRAEFVAFVVTVLQQLGLSYEAAVLFAAHLARETGYGHAVHNNNFGNIKTGSVWTGPYYMLTDAHGNTAAYRAYDTPEDGLRDAIAFIQTRNRARYLPAWTQLVAGDPHWYGTLGIAGYYEGPPDPTQRSGYQPITPANVGAAQADYDATIVGVRRLAPSPLSSGSGSYVAAAIARVAAWWKVYRG